MSAFGGWQRFFRLSESPRHRQREVDDELRFHVESLVERHIAQGMSEEEAWEVVMRRFHGYRATRDELIQGSERHARLEGRRLFFDELRQDLRVSWRQYVKRPGFAAMAVLILGLGIGASTTMFSVVNGVLLDPLPYPDSDRLVYVGTSAGGRQFWSTTAPEFSHLRNRSRSLERFAAYRQVTLDIQLPDGPERFTVADVTEDYFDIFGIDPAIGRVFAEEEYRADAPRVALLSHAVWMRHWGGAPDIVGTVITGRRRREAEHEVVTVVGVMPRDFQSSADLWIPVDLQSAEWQPEIGFGRFVFTAIGRLRPGSRVEDLQGEATAASADLAVEYPMFHSGRFNEGRTLSVTPLLDQVVGGYRSSILILFGAAVVLMTIALTNLTGLLLARALQQRQETAMRLVLGAGRGRIFRLLSTETTILSLLGGGLGLALSLVGVRLLQALGPADLPRLENLTPDLRVVAFSVVIALVSGLLCAAASMPSTTRTGISPLIRGATQVGGLRGTARIRGFLVTAQVALAVVLLVSAGLLAKSLFRLQDVDPGIEVEGLIVMPIQLTGPRYYAEDSGAEEYVFFFREVAQRMAEIPGVVSASWVPDPPIYGRNMIGPVWTEEMVGEDTPPLPGIHPVGPNYFDVMGIPVIAGRGITWADDEAAVAIAVVDRIAAEQLWPSQDPLGKRLEIWDSWFTVVGVVGNIRHRGLSGEAEPEVYISALQKAVQNSTQRIVIRSPAPREALAPHLREAVWEVDPTVPVPSIETMEGRVSVVLREPRFYVFLMGAFSLIALVLTLAGIYGLMSYWVNTRTPEVGLRMALGARSDQVVWAVSRQALLLLLAGLTVGLGLAAASTRLLEALLFAVSALDLPTFGMVAGGVGVIALLACLVPAARATRIDPTTALRGE